MSANQPTNWRTPPAQGELTRDGQRYRLTWYPSKRYRCTALFRVATDDNVAILQHIRRIRTGGTAPTDADIDPHASLEEIPAPLRAVLRDAGYTLAEDGGSK